MGIWPTDCSEHIHYMIKVDGTVIAGSQAHHLRKRQIFLKRRKGNHGPSISFLPSDKKIIKKVLKGLKENYRSVADLYPDYNPELFLTSCEVCGNRDIDHWLLVNGDGTEVVMIACKRCLQDEKTGGSA